MSDFTVTVNTSKVVPEENWMTLADAIKLKRKAFDVGHNAGMERAAEIAESFRASSGSLSARGSLVLLMEDIRKEIT